MTNDEIPDDERGDAWEPEPATPPLPPLWPHQSRGIDGIAAAARAGQRAVVLATPTGGGKTRVMAELTVRAVRKGKRVVIYTNRKILTRQVCKALKAAGVSYGLVASGHAPDPALPVQVARFQTVYARCVKRQLWPLPEGDLILVDEAHANRNGVAAELILRHLAAGALVVGPTATPVGLGKLYQALVAAGTNSELREVGALVPCEVYAPEEPDMQGVKRTARGEFDSEEAARRAMQWVVQGQVHETWKRLNPWARPTLLFAPGVKESRWFAEVYWPERGVTAAHLDGETPEAERERILAGSRDGSIQVICSCGVLREGADLPWVEHGILIQVCGLLSTFLQIVGRLLRACPETGKTRCILQDHSGAWHRHGDPNADQTWTLDSTDRKAAKERKQAIRSGKLPEEICCPKCQGVRPSGPKCPHCGHEHVRSVRRVRMTDGKLVKKVGAVTKKQRQVSDAERVWQTCLYAALNAKTPRTLKQVAADFNRRTKRWPDGLPGVPPRGHDRWNMYVADACPHLKRRGQAS